MGMFPFEANFDLSRTSHVPVYKQLVNAALQALEQGLLQPGTTLPSINQVSEQCRISRATVEKAYGHLRALGVLDATQGKGFFIAKTQAQPGLRILMLFNQLNAYNKQIYDAFADSLGPRADIDFHVYHDSAAHFMHILKKRQGYTHFVIIPHFADEPDRGHQLIDKLPKEKLILLGKNMDELSGKFGAVYENFACNIYDALTQLLGQLRKYYTINLIHTDRSYFPEEIRHGFIDFCQENRFCYKISSEIRKGNVQEGEAYVVISDDQMMFLLREINDLNLVTGKDIGVISYNENTAKRLIMNGVTTISTDFRGMGKSAAQMILSRSLARIENPYRLALRASV